MATKIDLGYIKGPKGDKGEKGDTGARGPQGVSGATAHVEITQANYDNLSYSQQHNGNVYFIN